MRNLWKGGLAILGAIAISTVGMTEAHAQQTVNAWSPKPTTLAPYVNGNKPWTKLSEVLADGNCHQRLSQGFASLARDPTPSSPQNSAKLI